jgi:hypothetical protein
MRAFYFFFKHNCMTYHKNRNYRFIALCSIAMLLLCGFKIPHSRINNGKAVFTDTVLLKLSEKFLYDIRTASANPQTKTLLSKIGKQQLIAGLDNDLAKKTFWLNMYNGWFQLLASRKRKKGVDIFTAKVIPIAGNLFSLDEMEHGILRKDYARFDDKHKYPHFPVKLVKQLAVTEPDYRIHFALNCGAKSCPPIAMYQYGELDRQLDIATRSFLSNNTGINDTAKAIHLPQIINWFMNDFGGKTGIYEMIKQVLKKDVEGYEIIFSDFNWEANLRNFKKE